MPTSLQSLDIATLVFFAPLLLLTIPILHRHSAKKDLPWFWLFLACAFRIAAASVGYVAATPQSPSKTRTEVTYITSSLVPVFLVVVFTGIVNRVLMGVGNGRSTMLGLPAEKCSWVSAFALTAVVVGIIGGVRSYDDDVGTQLEGQKYCGIATTLVFVQFLLVVGIVVFAVVVVKRQGEMLSPGDWKLLICAVGSVPVLFVRVVFATCVAWLPNVEVLDFPSDKPAAMAIWVALGLVMEVAVAGLYIAGGLFAPKLPEGEVRNGEMEVGEEKKSEVQIPKGDDGLECGYTK